MKDTPRSRSILRDIAPALESARRADGYYPALVVVRQMIAARHGEAAANTLYHGGLGVLIQRHIAPLYSKAGARAFASAARKQERQPLQNFNWFGAHASPFLTALDWLYFKLERLTVGQSIPVRSDLHITRTDAAAFRVRFGTRTTTVRRADYGQAVAGLMVALLFGGDGQQPVRNKHDGAQFGTVAVV